MPSARDRYSGLELNPPDDSLPPGIDQTQRQHGDEEDDLDEAEETKLLEDHCPGENEDDIHVEGDEEQRKDIERQRILNPRRTDGCLAGFVGRELIFRRSAFEQQRIQHVCKLYAAENKRTTAEKENCSKEIAGCDHLHLLGFVSVSPVSGCVSSILSVVEVHPCERERFAVCCRHRWTGIYRSDADARVGVTQQHFLKCAITDYTIALSTGQRATGYFRRSGEDGRCAPASTNLWQSLAGNAALPDLSDSSGACRGN